MGDPLTDCGDLPANAPKPKKFTLKSSDGQTFEVEEEVAAMSLTIKHMFQEGCPENAIIPLPNVNSNTLAMVIEYCEKHVHIRYCARCYQQLKAWDTDFIKVDTDTLYDLIMAANYMNIQSLLDLASQTVADMAKGKTSEEIRKIFNIKNTDFAPGEEEQIRRENQWAFDK